jgi:hypothetical protein
MDVVHLGYSFGMLDSQTGRMVSGIMSAVHLFLSLKAVLTTTTVAQEAQNVATGTHVALQGAAIGGTITHTISLMAHAVASGVAAAATWFFNAGLAMQVSLLTLGVGLIAVTAGYMLYLAAATRAAASAHSDYNAEVARTPYRSIRRAGEEESLRSRGIEW